MKVESVNKIMIKVLIPSDLEFREYEGECKKLYESLQDKICDPNSFEFITNNTFFYLFTDDDRLLGGIYYFIDDKDRLFVNAFADRKTHKQNMECLKLSTKWFKGNIYAEAQNRASVLCLLRCGFKRENNNLYVLKQ